MEKPTPEPRSRYRITVEAMPGWIAPPLKRLGRLLKIAQRTFGLKNVGYVEDVTPEPEGKDHARDV